MKNNNSLNSSIIDNLTSITGRSIMSSFLDDIDNNIFDTSSRKEAAVDYRISQLLSFLKDSEYEDYYEELKKIYNEEWTKQSLRRVNEIAKKVSYSISSHKKKYEKIDVDADMTSSARDFITYLDYKYDD